MEKKESRFLIYEAHMELALQNQNLGGLKVSDIPVYKYREMKNSFKITT